MIGWYLRKRGKNEMFTKQNVITARFIDNEHTTIEVVHTIESDEKAHAYILEYDKDSEDFKSLENVQ